MLSRHKCNTKEEVQSKMREIGRKSVLVFGSETCPPCKQLNRMLEYWKTDKNLNFIDLKKPEFVDMDYFKEKYRLTGFPTLVVVADESLEKIDMLVGFKGEESIFDFINKNFD
jgi:thiol-disulfide isomerase/thioredoxin